METIHHFSRANSRFVPSQWETSLQSNAISHWLGVNQESALIQAAPYLWELINHHFDLPHTYGNYPPFWAAHYLWKLSIILSCPLPMKTIHHFELPPTYGNYPPFWAVPAGPFWWDGRAFWHPPDTPWRYCDTAVTRGTVATRYRSTHGSSHQTLMSAKVSRNTLNSFVQYIKKILH